MVNNFHYGGMPPAMARRLAGLGFGGEGEAQETGSVNLPEVPRRELPDVSQFMPQAPQAPPMQSFMPQMQQPPDMSGFMPQAQQMGSSLQGNNAFMPQGRSGMMDMGQFMPTGDRTQQNMIFSDIMAQRRNPQAPEPLVDGGGRGSGGNSNGQLGALSAKYESNGSAGTIARTKGDIGGASYGTYQLTTSSGHAQKFANSYGGALKGKKPGTAAFDAAWKAEAQKNPKAFASAQHKYIENNHYKPAANNIKKQTGFDVSKYPKAVQDAVWSIGVQHGAGGAASIFRNAGVKNGMSAEQVLKSVYNERMKTHIYFKSSPKNIQNSVKKRFQSELNDALKML